MKKLTGILFLIATIAMAFNFNGRQTINGLRNVALFTVASNGAGPYFIKGYLTIPQPSTTGGTQKSGAQALVYKGSVIDAHIIYTGVSGASGFSIPSVALVSGDAISVSIVSAQSVDSGLNAVRGDVFFGYGL